MQFDFKSLQSIDELIKFVNVGEEDQQLIYKSYELADEIHQGQVRSSGQPWIQHCLTTAYYIAQLQLGVDAICASILHDALETQKISIDRLAKTTNEDIALLVDGVSHFRHMSAKIEPEEKANLKDFRKLLIRSTDDIRILIIRIAEKVEGIQDVEKLDQELRQKIAYKSLNVYGRLCEYVGLPLWQVKLEGRAFKINNPEAYQIVHDAIIAGEEKYQFLLEHLSDKISTLCEQKDIHLHSISFRRKGTYSAYKKIKAKHLKFEEKLTETHVFELNDLLGIRVITDTVEQCYIVLGLVHERWQHDESEFDDYIINPRSSGYQSIHTAIKYQDQLIDIQIRTQDMHEFNEFGPASHVAYKEGGLGESFDWLKTMHSWKDKSDTDRFKVEAFASSNFVFTPAGKVIRLNKRGTVLDFAFLVHTDIGYKYKGALVNDKMVSMDYQPQTGDVIEIITSNQPTVNRGWLDVCNMNYAKGKIRRFLRSK